MRINFVRIIALSTLFLLLSTPAFAIGKPQDVGQHGNGQGEVQHGNNNGQNVPSQDVSQIGKNQNPGQHSNNPNHMGPNGNINPSGKLRSCQAIETGTKNRTSALVNLATQMEQKFDNIAQRVEEYYKSKVVPSGKSVADYDTLVADIQANKTEVQTALASAQTDSNFSCDNADTKTELTTFRTDMQAVKSALKDYRTAIKNLIVAVHSINP